MEAQRLTAPDGVELYVEVRGQGAPLLLIHGWTLDQRVFTPQFDAFAEYYRTVSFDRRGCGRSGGVPDLSRELDDIDAVLSATCGDAPAHILGMSQGGRLAMRYLVTRPERVRSLVLQGPALDGCEPRERVDEFVPMVDFARLARAGDLDSLRRRWLAHPMMRAGISGEAATLLARIVGDYSARDLVEPAGNGFTVDVQAALAEVKVPLLVLTGEEETEARRRIAARILECAPGAREVLLPGCGHISNLGDPERYNREVLDFLAAC